MTIKVYSAITGIISDLSKSGVGKEQTNTFDKYKFRGIDDVYNALAPLLAKHNLCVLPKVLSRESVERVSKNGGALFYITVMVEYAFVSAEDGSSHIVVSVGEAMDRGDKATNKAMSAAFKYACFQAFCIPTEGDNDADGQGHEVVSQANIPELLNLLSSGDDMSAVIYWRSIDQDQQQYEWRQLDKPAQNLFKKTLTEYPAPIKKATK